MNSTAAIQNDTAPHAARLDESVRRRWEALDWQAGVPAEGPVMPEAHYLDLSGMGLTGRQRERLCRLFACFTCELFVHFERYVIAYLEGAERGIPSLPGPLVRRFIAEERVHSEMFRRLLGKLDGGLYPDEGARLRFLRWGRGDDVALSLAPVGTFFLLAWYFEEITLFVPRAIDACPGQSSRLVADVMRLHAEEERPHVMIDARVLAHLTSALPASRARLETALSLPMLVYVDGKVRAAWRELVDHAAAELSLTAEQRARLEQRGPTQSDRWGTESFADKLTTSGVRLGPALAWVLRKSVPAAER